MRKLLVRKTIELIDRKSNYSIIHTFSAINSMSKTTDFFPDLHRVEKLGESTTTRLASREHYLV